MTPELRERREVFPVGLLAGGTEVWLVWESGDEGDRFLKASDGFIWAVSLPRVVEMISDGGEDLVIEGESFYDVDGCISALRGAGPQHPDMVVEIWNILTDLLSTVLGVRRKFHSELADSYDVFFSRCEVAGFIGIGPGAISEIDVANALVALEDGILLIRSVTQKAGLDAGRTSAC